VRYSDRKPVCRRTRGFRSSGRETAWLSRRLGARGSNSPLAYAYGKGPTIEISRLVCVVVVGGDGYRMHRDTFAASLIGGGGKAYALAEEVAFLLWLLQIE
jgi:hypothetical protein